MVGSGAALRSRTEESGPRVRLVVLSDRRLFREALVAGIAACTQCAILGHASDIDDALLLCRLCRPTAVVLDVDCRGPQARLGELAAVVRVVAVYDRLSPADVNTLRSCGVYNLVSMSDGLDGLLRQLLPDETFAMVDESSVELVGGLTTLECTILRHLGDGQTADGLARELGISLTAVTNAKRRVYRKMNVASQTQAVALARALRIVVSPTPVRPAEVARMPPRLTPREFDILCSIALGHTVRQTARHLGIATKTVENTQARLFFKLGVNSRVAALAAAHGFGLLEATGPVTARQPEPPGGTV